MSNLTRRTTGVADVVARGAQRDQPPSYGEVMRRRRATVSGKQVKKWLIGCVVLVVIVFVVGSIVGVAVIQAANSAASSSATTTPTTSASTGTTTTTGAPTTPAPVTPAPAPTAPPNTPLLTIELLCNTPAADSTTKWVAVFNYTLVASDPITVDPGANNFVSPDNIVGAWPLPSTFEVGEFFGGAAIEYTRQPGGIAWTIFYNNDRPFINTSVPDVFIECPPVPLL